MLTALVFLAATTRNSPDSLADAFKNPPLSARPHTWWHWMNGNVTKEGITADLEAMKQVGIGGAQMFTVDQGIPAGPAGYAGAKWREMTAFAVKEAGRLGLELCLHNCAGWSSSGGPWIKPEHGMQVIAWSDTHVHGPTQFSEELPKPKAPHVEAQVPFYEDIAVYAYQTPADGDVAKPAPQDLMAKTGVFRGDGLRVDTTPGPAGLMIPSSGIVVLSKHMDKNGVLTWDVPEGDWTILRMGHVPTGIDNHPAPPEGDGLEVDKLSREALDEHWAGLMGKVISDVGPLVGKVLNNALIDSYEVGTQNWTPKFREEFRKRRGYDPMPFLPVIAGRTIDSHEKSERFLWDVRKTIADLFADNYFGYFAELCHKAGLKFSTEPYGSGGFDTIQSGSKADIPMGEFWLGGGAMETTKLASSIGHVYGRPVIGAESFTGDDVRGRWLEEPYMMKTLGDQAFCNGINRYIFHRYAMQPWLNLKPGMTMGPWGTHLERTQTWWTEAATWLRYVARCQYLLQSGRFAADVCYYYGEDSPNDLPYGNALNPKLPAGYDYDGCDANALLSMTVRNGMLVLPSGMTYRLLVLPNTNFMTVGVVKKIRDLVSAGASIYGTKPTQSPSLQGYPACDNQVRSIANQIWGSDSSMKNRVSLLGKGRVIWDTPLADVMKGLHTGPDFDYSPHNFTTKLIDIHRKIGSTDVYFVSNQNYRDVKAECSFRSTGRVPELWHPESGKTADAIAYTEKNGRTYVTLNLATAESVFVVFRKPIPAVHLRGFEPLSAIRSEPRIPLVSIENARYESVDGRGTDVTDKVKEMVKEGQFEIPATNVLFGDPIVNVVKHLKISYRLSGKLITRSVPENDTFELMQMGVVKPAAASFEVARSGRHSLNVTSWKPNRFLLTDGGGKDRIVSVSQTTKTLDLSNAWNLSFPPKLGAPATAKFDRLISWPASSNPGIRYFSGSATYAKTFVVPPTFVQSGSVVRLDLGEVKNFATVTLNGKLVATLWKPPFAVDVTSYLHSGQNVLKVKVTNLWPNRLIGDEQLPADVQWDGDHLAKWPAWLLKGQPRPATGRVAFSTWHFYNKNSPLLESGMIGPVRLESTKPVTVRF